MSPCVPWQELIGIGAPEGLAKQGNSMITLDRSAIGPKLSEFIRGWKSVEPLRRLVAGKGTECDLEDAAAWTRHWYLKMVYSAAYIPELTFETHHLWFKLMQMINPEDTIPIPDGLELLPFQITGARFIIDHDFAIVGDEMGTGKTIQTIAALNAITPGRILIVCTASLKSNWKYELEKWSTRPYKINIVTTRTKSFDGDVVIINYDLLKVRNLGDQHFDTVICDEAHNIANIESAKTKEALQWAEKAKIGRAHV